MENELATCQSNKKFNIRVNELFAGWMDTEITVDGTIFWHMFDEALSDPTLDLMKTYLAIRDYQEDTDAIIWRSNTISWFWSDRTTLLFQLSHVKEDNFQLHIEAQLYEGESDTLVKTITITKAELLHALDTFFTQILNDKGFPLQYPAGCAEDVEETRDKAEDMIDEIVRLLPKQITSQNKIYNGIMNICMNAVVQLAPNEQEYVNKYKEMLETHTIPKNFT